MKHLILSVVILASIAVQADIKSGSSVVGSSSPNETKIFINGDAAAYLFDQLSDVTAKSTVDAKIEKQTKTGNSVVCEKLLRNNVQFTVSCEITTDSKGNVKINAVKPN